MLELFFVLGFFAVLLMTGLSLLGAIAALVAGFVVMLLAGMLAVAFNVLPWLIVAVIVVWFIRTKTQYGRRYLR
ncbi:MAG: envelope stress response protein PspG [Plesiomonas sp.]|uniref:envelope stress response protein PspG n=1 Tax=Plesiomonas sp. TaxID=2486279 RepID=UPI003F403736